LGTIYKVVRGGGFDGNNSLSKTTYRCLMRPTSRIEWVGFRRCAVSAGS
jgi:formylglycine-generating enzyme required for sulfatase activity